MLKIVDVNASTFRDSVLNALAADPDLNLDVSPASFVYKIIDALATGQLDVFSAMNQLITNNTFETLEGEGLDRFFEIFNITRLQYANGTYEISISYNSELSFSVLEGTLIEYDGTIYVSSFKTDFTNTYQLTNIALIVQPVVEQNFNVSDFLNIDNGSLKIDFNGIAFDGDKIVFKSDVESNTTVTDFEVHSQNVEADTSFLNRAQNLFQFYSSDSVEKILLSIETIAGVNDTYYVQDGLTTKIVVIPNDISTIDTVLESSQEIVDYYKNTNVVLDRPSYIAFSVTGILNQLSNDIKANVQSWIENYIRTIYLRDNTFVREDFEFKLIEYIRSLSTSSNTINVNRSNIKITYNIYAKSDFDLLISSGTIYQNDVRSFAYGIYNCDLVG